MGLLNALKQDVERYGIPTKKERLRANTPLKHFLRPIMEERVKRQLMQSLQAPQLGAGPGPMVEPPSISPLQNALMSVPQGGGGGMPKPPQGGGQSYAS